ISAEARVPSHLMRTGQMNDDEWGRLAQTMSALADAPIYIGTLPYFRIDKLGADATRLSRESGLKLLLIDSSQWITDPGPSARASSEFILQRLKTLAKALKIPIIITANVKRRHEALRAINPIEQLKHNDAIDQVADVVIILNRPDQDDREHPRSGEAD